MSNKEPGFWRGFVWGFLITPAIGIVASTIIAVAGVVVARGTIDKGGDA